MSSFGFLTPHPLHRPRTLRSLLIHRPVAAGFSICVHAKMDFTSTSTPDTNYRSPLSTRYASLAMRTNFADITRFRLWRKLWLALAESQRELGLEITDQQIEALRRAADPSRLDVDLDTARQYEMKLRHDVMAHVHALSDQIPVARPIIHLGATSCFVTDNSEVIQMKDALDILIPGVWNCVAKLAAFANEWKYLPCLGFTHCQPSQPTTMGKRACLWLQDFMCDALRLEEVQHALRLRGVKGTTGTQASFMTLLNDNAEKVARLDELVTSRMGFTERWKITGQTYPRKQDFTVVAALAGIGQSAAKMANDIRLLQHMKEVEEPFDADQIGSSAMAYKRNPMRCERICGLARFLQSLLINPAETASTQWLERSLDDSANRRLTISEAFLSADAIVQLVLNVCSGLVVYPQVVTRHLQEELPFMITETILMSATVAGGDRQVLHEAIRRHSMTAALRVKQQGLENNLIQLIANDDLFASVKDELESLEDPTKYVGRAPQQVDDFLINDVYPALEKRRGELNFESAGDVRV